MVTSHSWLLMLALDSISLIWSTKNVSDSFWCSLWSPTLSSPSLFSPASLLLFYCCLWDLTLLSRRFWSANFCARNFLRFVGFKVLSFESFCRLCSFRMRVFRYSLIGTGRLPLFVLITWLSLSFCISLLAKSPSRQLGKSDLDYSYSTCIAGSPINTPEVKTGAGSIGFVSTVKPLLATC